MDTSTRPLRRRFTVESLEERRLLTGAPGTYDADNGPLRAAIVDAKTNNGTDQIELDIPGEAVNGDDDHGDDAGSATSIGVPSSTSGDIEESGDKDWFQFTAVDGARYVFETKLNSLSDSKLALFAADGTSLLDSNDDGGDELASRIEWTAPTDGTNYLQVTAFTGSQRGTYALDVSSTGGGGTGVLTLTVAATSIPEIGGSSSATVSRTGSSGNVLVNLSSNDLTEATVPSSVTIPNGSNSVTFTVTAVHDGVVDGTQTVTITASANGHTNDTDTISVTDNDTVGTGVLTLDVLQTSMSEKGGTSSATVTRTGSSGPLTVNLVSSDTSEATVPISVTIPDGSNSVIFDVTAVDDAEEDGPQTVTISASATAHSSATDTILVEDSEAGGGDTGVLTLDVIQNSMPEVGGSSSATVSRIGVTGNLLVNLVSNDLTEATVPSSVTIPNGSNSVTFTVTALPDGIVDGTQTVTITASASGHANGTDTILVLDSNIGGGPGDDHGDDAGSATPVAVPSVTPGDIEAGGDADWFRFTAVAGGEYVFQTILNSLNDSKLALYAPNGTTVLASNDDSGGGLASRVQWTATSSGPHFLEVIAFDSSGTGTYSLDVSSSVGGGLPGVLTLNVLQKNIPEKGGSSSATVSRTGTAGSLLVNLSSDDETEAVVPSSVTILNGFSSVTFTVTAVDDVLADGTQTVTITASASGHTSGTDTIFVEDSEDGSGGAGVLTLNVLQTSMSEIGGSSSATVSRSDTVGFLIVNLISSDSTEAVVPSSVTIPNGAKSTSFTVTAVDDFFTDGTQTVTITASASEHTSGTDTILVTDNETGPGGDDHGNNAGTATPITIPSATPGSIEPGGDTDWFRFTSIAGSQYVFETTLGTLSDSELSLYASNGNSLLDSDDDSGEGFASRIDWTAPTSGTHYLEVTGFTGGQTGTYTLQVSGPSGGPGPNALTLNVLQTSMPENGGSSSATVSRTGFSGSLFVNLNSSDTSEATVPSFVTIPNGSSSVSFTVSAVDDFFADGTQTVTITASASGHSSGTDTILVTDNEGVGGPGDDHGDNAGTATPIGVPSATPGNIEVGGDLDWFRFTTVAGTEYVFETTLGTLSDSELALYASNGISQLDSDDDDGVGFASRIEWTAPTSGTHYLEVKGFGSSNTGSYTLNVSGPGGSPDPGALTLNVLQTSMPENGSSFATVSRSGFSGTLFVSLSSSDTSEAVVPSSVTIPNGSNSVSFNVSAVDDGFVDGTQTVTITASASGFASGFDTIQVVDNDGGGTVDDHGDDAGSATQITVPSSTRGDIEEGLDKDWFRLTTVAGTRYVFETTLDSLIDTKLALFASNGTTLLDSNDDGGRELASRIEWTAPTSGTHYLQVRPFSDRQTGTYTLDTSSRVGGDPGALTLNVLLTSMPEIGGASSATLSRTSTSGSLFVNLSSSDTTEAVVPSSVTIPNGSSSVTFTVTAVDDFLPDGAQTVTITATASGHTNGIDTILVTDDETGGGGGGDDHGDNAGTATQIGIPSVIPGDIEEGGDQDWFRFTSVAGAQYEFETTLGGLGDSTLALYASNGTTQLLSDDDGGVGFASKIEWTAPTSGTHYLEVRGFGAGQTGTYTLDVSSTAVGGPNVLTLNVLQTSMSENGGSSSATVSRTGFSGSLFVNLSSSDTSEASVPSFVTIPNGSSSVSFTVSAVDDFFADGAQTVTITASASGNTSGTDTIVVTDNETGGGGGGDDHGDNAGTATQIGVPSVTPGNIEEGGDTDWFRFNAVAGAQYVFETKLASLNDSTLALYASNGTTQLEENDDGGEGFASRIEWTALTSGTHYLEVTAFNTTETGTYTLDVSSTGGGTGSGVLTLNVLRASMPENGGVSSATVSRTGFSGSLFVSLSSSDTSEATVPSFVTIQNGANSATFTVTARPDSVADGAQTVTITASASGHSSGTDTISVLDSDGGSGGGDDHGNNAGTATSIGVPSATLGNIEVGGDTDWFRFNAVAGAQYVFETKLGSLNDSQLALYASNGTTQLLSNDDGGDGLASLIEWTAPTGGLHYLEVTAFGSNAQGTYTLDVSGTGGGGGGGGDDHGDNSASATQITVPSVILGDIEVGGDTDWFRFTAVAGVRYAFETSLKTLNDTKLRLYAANGSTLIEENDDGGTGLASQIEWTAPAGGTYYLEVTAFSNDSTGSYTLDVASGKVQSLEADALDKDGSSSAKEG